MTSGAAKKCSLPPSTITAHYETLRRAALGEALPPEARSGLMLFLRRGMWAWARMLAAPNTREPPMHTRSPSPTATGERQAVIYAVAAMAMSTLCRRTL